MKAIAMIMKAVAMIGLWRMTECRYYVTLQR